MSSFILEYLSEYLNDKGKQKLWRWTGIFCICRDLASGLAGARDRRRWLRWQRGAVPRPRWSSTRRPELWRRRFFWHAPFWEQSPPVDIFSETELITVNTLSECRLLQRSFRETGTMETLASQWGIGIWVQAQRSVSAEVGGYHPRKMLILYMRNPEIWLHFWPESGSQCRS